METGVLLFNQFAGYFLLLLVGLLTVKSKILKVSDGKIFSTLLLYVVVPCVVVKAFQIEATFENVKGFLLALGAAAALHVLLMMISALFGKLPGFSEVDQMSVMYSNGGNMIIPVILVVLGEEWVFYTSAFITVQTCLLWTHCKSVLSRTRVFDLKNICRNVNLWAILLGVLLFSFRIKLPPLLLDMCSSLGGMLAPLGMIVTGMLIAGMDAGTIFGSYRIYVTAGVRLLVCPLLVLFCIWVSGAIHWMEQANKILFVVYLAAIAPVSSTVTQICQFYDREAEYEGALNAFTTLISILTMPVMAGLYSGLFGI